MVSRNRPKLADEQELDRARLGELLREHRVECQLTQAEVAWWSGITQGALSNYENGKRDIPLSVLISVCRVLEVDPCAILSGLPSAADNGA